MQAGNAAVDEGRARVFVVGNSRSCSPGGVVGPASFSGAQGIWFLHRIYEEILQRTPW